MVSSGKRLRRRVRFLLLRAVLGAASYLPRRAGLALCAQLGELALACHPRGRAQILVNSRRIHPDWPAAAHARFARRNVRAVAGNLFDFIRLRRYSLAEIERLVRVQGAEHLRRARRPGIGVICISAHLGCWELLPARMRAAGYAVAVVYRPLRERALDEYVARRRRRLGVATHTRDGGGRAVWRSLRDGALVGILIDQRTRVESVPADFLGHPAPTPTAPVRLAWRTGAPVVPVTIARDADRRYTLTIGPEVVLPPPPEPAAGEAEVAARLTAGCRACNAALEERVRAHPEQWVWFHARWD